MRLGSVKAAAGLAQGMASPRILDSRLPGRAQGAKPDYLYLLQRMCMDNPEAAVGLAKSVARQPGPPIELNTLADVFLQRNMVREATAFLLDVLQGDDPAHDKLQTKVRARRGRRSWGRAPAAHCPQTLHANRTWQELQPAAP